jgi:biotin carboxylase
MATSKSLEPITVMITAAGGAGAPGIIRSLKHNGERKLRVVAVDMSADAVGLHLADAGYTVPAPSDESYGEAILGICEKESVRVILPGISYELAYFAHNRKMFLEAGVITAAPSEEDYPIMDNKANLYQALREADIPIAPYCPIESLGDLDTALRVLNFPERGLVLKNQLGSGGKGMYFLRGPGDLDRVYSRLELDTPFQPRVLMEYLPGIEYSNDLISDSGNVVAFCPRIREMIKGGASCVGRIDFNDEVEDLCRRIMKVFNYRGNANVQVKEGSDGKLYPIEINPRLSGTVVLATAAGCNLPYLGVKLHLGEPFEAPEPVAMVRMVRYWDEVYTSPDGGQFRWP